MQKWVLQQGPLGKTSTLCMENIDECARSGKEAAVARDGLPSQCVGNKDSMGSGMFDWLLLFN